MTSMPFRRCLLKNINFLKNTFVRNHQQQFILNCAKYHNFTKKYILQNPKSIARIYSTNDNINKSKNENNTSKQESKFNIFHKMKIMYKDYWYVVIPVHLITSVGWFGGFYYMAKSGVDVVAILQNMGISEQYLKPLKDSSMGYIAIAFALYKLATPLRYTVTLGGTTVAIKYLREMGYIKPVLSKDKLKEIYTERKNHIRETIQETKEELRQRKDQLKERKDNIMGDYANFKKELKDINVNFKKEIKEK